MDHVDAKLKPSNPDDKPKWNTGTLQLSSTFGWFSCAASHLEMNALRPAYYVNVWQRSASIQSWVHCPGCGVGKPIHILQWKGSMTLQRVFGLQFFTRDPPLGPPTCINSKCYTPWHPKLCTLSWFGVGKLIFCNERGSKTLRVSGLLFFTIDPPWATHPHKPQRFKSHAIWLLTHSLMIMI